MSRSFVCLARVFSSSLSRSVNCSSSALRVLWAAWRSRLRVLVSCSTGRAEAKGAGLLVCAPDLLSGAPSDFGCVVSLWLRSRSPIEVRTCATSSLRSRSRSSVSVLAVWFEERSRLKFSTCLARRWSSARKRPTRSLFSRSILVRALWSIATEVPAIVSGSARAAKFASSFCSLSLSIRMLASRRSASSSGLLEFVVWDVSALVIAMSPGRGVPRHGDDHA